MSQFNHIFRLSFRDYSHEWRMSICFILALASVLAPMMILFGLKFGIVSSMVSGLVENPINREIRPIGSGSYSESWIQQYQDRPEVEFIIPKTRSLAATIQLKSETAQHILSTEMMPTAKGDPLLAQIDDIPTGYYQIILSKTAAQKLKVTKGQAINASISRQFRGQRERVHLTVKVIDITDTTANSRNIAFVSLDLLLATEQFKDGRSVSALNWSGDSEVFDQRKYPSFRLYTKSIYDVSNLTTDLEKQGIRVKANTAEINTVQTIDQNLSIIFWIIACVAAVGFAFSLGASLWANVDRKKKDLSTLRLLGFKSSQIVLFPVIQSALTGLLGWLFAVLIYLISEYLINTLLASRLNLDQTLCFLLPKHFFWAFALTMITAVLSAILGGIRAASIEPSDGLRDI